MQRLVFVRYTVKPDQIAENEALTHAVFKELRSTAPKDLMYSVFQKGADFVHVLVNSRADNSSAHSTKFNARTALRAACASVKPPRRTGCGLSHSSADESGRK